MQNLRSVALLKQIEKGFSQTEVRGVARIEKDKLSLSIINLQSVGYGEYFVFYDGLSLPLTTLSGGEFALKSEMKKDCGISLLHKDGDTLKTVAYGGFSPLAKNEKEILLDAKKFFKITDEAGEKLPVFQAQEYDDEALATDNYYGFDLQSVMGEDKIEDQFVSERDLENERASLRKEEEKGAPCDSWQDEMVKGDEPCEQGQDDYYYKIKSRLNDLFKDFPPQTQLANMVNESRWAKVESGGKHYVVGVICERGLAKYICYGLPGLFSKEPDSLKGYSSFIPLSPFDLKGEGYWVMFQDAESGKRIAKG